MEKAGKLPEQVKKAHERGSQLREHQQKHPDENPRDMFERLRKEQVRPLHEIERKALEGYREKPGDKTPPKEIQQVLDFDTYVRVERSEEAYKKAGMDPAKAHEQALNDVGIKGDSNNKLTSEQQYNQLRDGVMDNLLTQKSVQALIPEVSELTDQKDKRDYVDAVIASDENVRRAVMEKGRAIAKKALELPRADTTSEQQQAAENAQKAAIDAINQRLVVTQGHELKSDDIKDALDQGDISGVKSAMYRKSLEAQGVADSATAEAYLVNRDDLIAKKAALPRTTSQDHDRLKTEIAQLEEKIRVQEGILKIKDDSGRQDLAQKDAKAFAAVYGSRTRDGSMSGGMDQDAQDLINAARQKKTLEAQAGKNLTPDQIRAKTELQVDAAKAIHEGVLQGKDTTDQEARAIDARKMQADADAMEKAGKHEVAQAVVRLKAQMDEDWKKMVDGNLRCNKAKIGKDMAIYCDANVNREDAIANLIKSKVFAEGTKVSLTDTTGEITLTVQNGFLCREDGKKYVIETRMKDAYGNDKVLKSEATPENIPQALLSGHSKELIDGLIKDYGATVEKRLLSDYHYALKHNSRRDIGTNQDMSLSKDQKKEMMKKAGPILEEVISANGKSSELLKKCRENGMDMNILWMLIMAIGGGIRKIGRGGVGEYTKATDAI
jgi:hypothetical protein